MIRWIDSKIAFDKIFVISQHLQNKAKNWGIEAQLLYPPVTEDYFISPDDKPQNNKIKITYIGRTEKGKGIEEVLDIFSKLQEDNNTDLSIYGYHWPQDTSANDFHRSLQKQNKIKYISSEYKSYSQENENNLKKILLETDLLFLPYQDPKATIDLPLLFLEGLAAGCAVASRAFGDMANVYGNSPFLLPPKKNFVSIIELFKNKEAISNEQKRIFNLKKTELFKSMNIAKKFQKHLTDHP
jgi:glycosyltransferase involved in cell wall biosynthesis